MCGIAGVLSLHNNVKTEDLKKLSNSMENRGPDDEGFYVLTKDNLATVYNGFINRKDNLSSFNRNTAQEIKLGLVHRRFSIIDTSNLGHQPMISDDNKVSLVFNGEIFNYVEIRDELIELGYDFKSKTDTEVVLKSYLAWGRECFNKFNGFWAIAISDLNRDSLILCRDRFGQKPLYYYTNDSEFYFSSEIKSIRSVCEKINKIDFKSAYLYLYHDRRDSLSSSMFQDLNQVSPATVMSINLKSGERTTYEYWTYPVIDKQNSKKSISELSDELDTLISNAVNIRLRADVPIAANLSGGLDSAAIVYHASKSLKKVNLKLTTHTFDYKESKKLSEKNEAALISNHCNTDHEVLYFNSNDVWKDLNDLVEKLEEPVHSPAAYVQWLAWRKIADMGYKVILHGSANDELMMGYSYFSEIQDKFNINKFKFPSHMQGNSILYYKNILRIVKWIVKGEIFIKKRKTPKSHPDNPIFNKSFLNNNYDVYKNISKIIGSSDTGEKRRLADFKYLRIPFWNNFMDKSMMSLPIEVRSPFLDKNIVEFCFKNSNKIFYKKGWTKYVLRKSLHGKLPDEIVWNNRKKGFTSPTKIWIIRNKIANIYLLNRNNELKKIMDLEYLENNYEDIDFNLIWRLINFSIWIERFNLKFTDN